MTVRPAVYLTLDFVPPTLAQTGVSLNLSKLPARPDWNQALMMDFSRDAFSHNNFGTGIDTQRVLKELSDLGQATQQLGITIHEVPAPVNDLQAQFIADTGIPFSDIQNDPSVILSSLTAQRQRAVRAVKATLGGPLGFRTFKIANDTGLIEGMRDLVWHPSLNILWGGYGMATDLNVYYELVPIMGASLFALELRDRRFKDLTQCFVALDAETVLYCPDAFTPEGNKLIQSCFPISLSVSPTEALNFACSGIALSSKHYLMPKGNPAIKSLLKTEGFEVTEIDFSENQKLGGSLRRAILPFPQNAALD